MNLKLRHMAVFHAVMEEGSVSRAAERMGLTQPAVSVALTRLEEMLGYTLFHRSKGYFVPKPEAEQLHVDAELAILAFEKFATNARQIGRGAKGLVRLGSIGSTAIHFLPEVIAGFHQAHGEVEIDLQVRSSSRIVHFVGNGQMDIGIVEAPVSGQTLDIRTISLPCVCIMRHDDPLAVRQVIGPHDLAGRDLISVSDRHMQDLKLRDIFIEAGVPWKADIRTYFYAIIRNLVARGSGIAIIDSINGYARLNDGVIWRPFEPVLYYDLSIITRQGSTLQAAASLFLETIQDYLAPYLRKN